MNRRGRALGFLFAALLAAALAAAIADGYGASVSHGYGELQPVLVAAEPLAAGRAIGPRRAAQALEVRRVPARFVPPGALRAPAQALGLIPAGPIPAGVYLLASQLHPPRPAPAGHGLAHGRHPVQITVSGAEALLLAGAPGPGSRVDVIVTNEPSGAGAGRTYVAAAAVPLLALRPEAGAGGAGDIAAATLGLTRGQALRLIAAESFARQLTLLPRA